MSSLSTLAKDLEKKSKEQQHSTEQMLKTAFSAHEKSVSTALNSSVQTINAAIEDHNSRLSESLRGHRETMESALQANSNRVLRMTGRTWLTISLVTVLLTGTCGGLLWWQSNLIAANQAAIALQTETLAKLNGATWGVQFYEDSTGRFIVLPRGMTTDRQKNWTFNDGKQAVKLVQE
jgi:hypothetical protein